MLENKIKSAVRDVPNFPKAGIIFKDITPILSQPALCAEIVDAFAAHANALNVNIIAGIEARGFLFGPLVAQRLGIPFVPLRKSGKLPYKSFKVSYDLEYGSASLEMHQDAFPLGSKVLIHDDLLATGGTAIAAAKLIQNLGVLAGYSFLINLDFLDGRKELEKISPNVYSIVSY
jgi:adenine phosphoribosyltransferase